MLVDDGWSGFNGTYSTNRPYRAMEKVKVCFKKFISDKRCVV